MTALSTVELSDLVLNTRIGTYGPNDVVPDEHILDLSLTIDSDLVLIDSDEMDRVFDYDPLVMEIDKLARDCHYQTQERLITRIVEACATYSKIRALTIQLRKRPVLSNSGVLGVRLTLNEEALSNYRPRK